MLNSTNAQQVSVDAFSKISITQGGFNYSPGTPSFAPVPIGDVNGDGIEDLASSNPLSHDGGNNRGGLWILFMNNNSTVNSQQRISDSYGNFSYVFSNYDQFGWTIGPLGDLDNDGVPDIAVGGKFYGTGGHGFIWVLFLNSNGTVKNYTTITSNTNGFNETLDISDQFGFSIVALDDMDGDGVTELAVGARLDDDGGLNRGAIWILFMNSNGTVKSYQKISDTEGGFTATLYDEGHFGATMANLGDLDNDGVDDIAASSHYDSENGTQHGAFYILFLNTDGTVKSHQKISESDGGFNETLQDNDLFGVSLAGLGDLNLDGIQDMAVGANQGANTGTGKFWILNLNRDGTIKSHTRIEENLNGFTGDLDPEDRFAHRLHLLDDIENDGRTNLLVHASKDDDGSVDAGAGWFLNLSHPTSWHVDTILGDDSNDGTTRLTAFSTIQQGIDTAMDGDQVLVWPGVYTEDVDFKGKSITVKSAADPAIIQPEFNNAFTFLSNEDPNTVLENFVIRDAANLGCFVLAASPTIRNITFYNNKTGIFALLGSTPLVENCLFEKNLNDVVSSTPAIITTEYCGFVDGNDIIDLGTRVIDINNIYFEESLMVDPNAGDFHLQSEHGRFIGILGTDPNNPPEVEGLWTFDDPVTSPYIDAGDPNDDFSNERSPNGLRVNIGAFGNSSSASLSPPGLAADFNQDGIVDLIDLSLFLDDWLQILPWTP